jgi:hypothetical protein
MRSLFAGADLGLALRGVFLFSRDLVPTQPRRSTVSACCCSCCDRPSAQRQSFLWFHGCTKMVVFTP